MQFLYVNKGLLFRVQHPKSTGVCWEMKISKRVGLRMSQQKSIGDVVIERTRQQSGVLMRVIAVTAMNSNK